MKRRDFLKATLLGSAAASTEIAWAKPSSSAPHPVPRFELDETTLSDIQSGLKSGRFTAVHLVKKYTARIEQIDRSGPNLNAVIELNPDAFSIARDLDRQRKESGPRGPLHGIPVLIKDNIATRDRMHTSAGSLALSGPPAPWDSAVAQRLRAAGAVLLGKTNLSEWANFRSSRSTSGWSGRGGLTRNPYVLERNASGSSSGSGAAVAANLCPVTVGTETDGSILSPSSVCGIVGIKPTLGLISRFGIVPIAHSQDTAGPMARTVTDAALLLGVLAGEDPRDPVTLQRPAKQPTDYTSFLDANGVRGARIGVARKFFDIHPGAVKVIQGALETLTRLGAVLFDPADLPSHGKFSDAEMQVLLYEFKADLNAYLAQLSPETPVRTLADVIAFNEKNRAREMPHFEQEYLIQAEAKGPLTEQAYLDALEKCRRLSRAEGIDAVMNDNHLDALVAPTSGPAHVTDLVHGDRDIGGSTEPAAVAGYPSVTVPAGYVEGLPVGLSFFGRAYSEPTLLRLAYAFEQATLARRPPRFLAMVAE